MRTSLIAIAFLLVLPALQAARGATLFRTETRHLEEKGPPRENLLLADGQRMRLDAGDSSVVFHAHSDQGRIYVIDHSDHSYVEIDRNAMESMAKSLGEAKQEMRQRMAPVPPDRRKEAEKLLTDTVGPTRSRGKSEIRPTGRHDRVAGIPCSEVEVWVDGKKEADVCQASFADAHVPRSDLDAVREMVGMLRESAVALAPETLREGGLDAVGSLGHMDALPLRMRTYEDGKPVLETVVTEVKEEKAPAGAFQVPPGYHPRISIQVRKGAGKP